jgi:hypothetical protein
MIKIINNFLEEDLKIFLEHYFLSIPHNFGWSSAKETKNPFYQSNLNMQDPLINFLCLKIQKQVSYNLFFLRTYINIHYSDMPGDFHSDDGDTTFLLMTSKTLNKNSGLFQIKINNNDNEIQSIDFIQNRLIIFPAKWKHRGLDPIEKATPRITLAFKTQKHE